MTKFRHIVRTCILRFKFVFVLIIICEVQIFNRFRPKINFVLCICIFQARDDTVCTSSDLSLKEMVEKFCETTQVEERKQLAEDLCHALNCFSVDNTESCNVQLAERILRIYFNLHADQKSIEARIGVYCHHLVVMLQHGLQPETRQGEDNATPLILLDRLQDIVKPSVYNPTSTLRKDIETAIDMLSLFSAKSKKQQTLPKYVTKCFKKITSGNYTHENKIKFCLEKYLKSPTWIHLYLLITWLKIKVSCITL